MVVNFLMNRKTASAINVVVFTSLIAILSGVIYLNAKGDFTLLLFLSTLLIGSMSSRLLFIYEYIPFSLVGKIMIFTDVILVFFIGVFDVTGISKIIYLILLYDAFMAYTVGFGAMMVSFNYLLYLCTDWINHGKSNLQGFLPYLITDSAIFIFVAAIIFAAKHGWKVTAVQNDNEKIGLVSNNTLTEREQEIAGWMTMGLSNREIAAKLHLAEGTVKNNISCIYEKVGTNDRMKAVESLKNYHSESQI